LIRAFLSRLVPRRGPGQNLRHIAHGHQAIFLDYPLRSAPRYGYGSPPHPELYRLLDADRAAYARFLLRCLELSGPLASIPARCDRASPEPSWINGFLSGLDAAGLYATLALTNPARYVEVGSGNSTKFARRSIRDHGLRTKITSIDPHPRADIGSIADEVIRRRLEDSDLATVTSLGPGDVLFIDGSHRCFMNSDVTVTFLEVLPRLQAGVRVHFHDIFLPYDYPPEWTDHYYSEQYLLAAYLLGGASRVRILFPSAFASRDRELAGILDPIWNRVGDGSIDRQGCSFWMERTT
jgi:hypothetical protein